MVGYEDDYEEIETYSKYNRLSFGEFLFFAFSMEPQMYIEKYLSKLEHFSNRSPMKDFAFELLESGEVVFEMSEKYRKMNNTSSGGMAC